MLTINIAINTPIKIIVTRLSLFIIRPSIKIVESLFANAACKAEAPCQFPKIEFKNIIAKVTKTPIKAIPAVPLMTLFIVSWIDSAPFPGIIDQPLNNHPNKNKGNIIKLIDSSIKISRKYSGMGNNAKKNNDNINKPIKKIGIFGKNGTFQRILCIYFELKDMFSIVQPTVIPNPVIW